MTASRKRLDIGQDECKIIEIALRTALGRATIPADMRYLASPTGMAAASTVWAKVNAFRNYYSTTGAYHGPLYVPAPPVQKQPHMADAKEKRLPVTYLPPR